MDFLKVVRCRANTLKGRARRLRGWDTGISTGIPRRTEGQVFLAGPPIYSAPSLVYMASASSILTKRVELTYSLKLLRLSNNYTMKDISFSSYVPRDELEMRPLRRACVSWSAKLKSSMLSIVAPKILHDKKMCQIAVL